MIYIKNINIIKFYILPSSILYLKTKKLNRFQLTLQTFVFTETRIANICLNSTEFPFLKHISGKDNCRFTHLWGYAH